MVSLGNLEGGARSGGSLGEADLFSTGVLGTFLVSVGTVGGQSVAVIDGDVVAARISVVDLAWSDDPVLGVLGELVPVGQPPTKPWQGKEHSKELTRNLERLIDQTRIEINVRVELTSREVRILQSNSLQLYCHINQLLPPRDLKHLVCDFLYQGSPRIVVLIHSVSESHQQLLLSLHLFDKLRHVFFGTDCREHL